MLAVVPPLLQLYVYGAVPPVEVAVAVPLAAPKHEASVFVQVADTGAGGHATVVLQVVVQPLASVTLTLYGPIAKLLRLAVVAPLLHKYVYGAVPPVAVTLAVPVVVPWHATGVFVQVAVRPLAG